MTYFKQKKIRSKKITQSAQGKPCTLRIPGVCNGNPKTTVFAHLPGNKGIGTKNHDLFGVYACSDCHDWLDGRRNNEAFGHKSMPAYRTIMRALQETQIALYREGIINVN